MVVVDDDPDVRWMVRRALLAAGCPSAVLVDGGKVDLDDLAQRCARARLVVLDLHMPGLDGAAVLQALRAAGTAAPVVVFTSDPHSPAADAVRALGVPVVEKPVDLGRFDAAVRALYERHAR